MKSIAFIALVLAGNSFAACAQEAKLPVSPVYDNINYERKMDEQYHRNAKFALLEKNDLVKLPAPLNNSIDIIDLHNHTITSYPKQEYIKKVFPKNKPF